ncbi:hypothetical protein BX616_000972 [Lobosporangium transversale]|uniref:Alpha/Beta hydrolase protein n=1 Tax=Lobosporangium transversale TaxID=64571 RepID=A0A1Y2GSK0_9FUNG|nr:Alpha/Beta hydrolase protein [Lobosporangium transversale]KAF9905596.1 hypothetical protein BX616_000972 [Lobosporangium transversale]ORZ20071.1 Alpha/Beta hydrolase protein [Lobosporangium transversale]|eukprot:XP_021882611.1 Alpha/Beta hydrolase protein [Lobosporangium transversale]
MQRANSNGISFLRRRSSSAAPSVPYANPAATQFLRLGVGIDHVDVGHNDEEDVIYQGIENGMEGHSEDDIVSDEDEDDIEDEDILVEEEDINIVLQQELDKKTDDDNMCEVTLETSSNNNIQSTIDNCNSKSESSQPGRMVVQGERNDMQMKNEGTQSTGTGSGTGVSSLSSSKQDITNAAIMVEPAVTATTTTALSSSSNTHRIPVSINTQLNFNETLFKNNPTKSPKSPKSPISPTFKRQGPASPASPTKALAPGLPVYHEKFTKGTSNKAHGANPLSNANNTIIASSIADGSVPASPLKPPASRRNTNVNATPPAASTQRAQSTTIIPQLKHFAEKEGFVTVHNWKIHYKITYPTFDPSFRVNGNGRNIILFHGALSNLGTWRKVQQTLADRTGCRVLSFDRVGHGFSEKPATWPKKANPYKNGSVLAITQTLLESLGMDQNLILIGNDTGATIALAVALSKPEVVRGLILVAPAILDEAPPLYLRACVTYPPPMNWIYRGLYGNHGPLQQFYYKPKVMMSDPSTIEMYMGPTKDDGFWRGLANVTKYRTSYKINKHLQRLTELSTLVMTGDVDDVVPTIETLRLFEILQSVRQLNVPQVLKIIKHSGHLPQEEKPNDFINVVSFFIRKVCLGSLSREGSLGRRISGGVVRTLSKKSVSNYQNAGNSGYTGMQMALEANSQVNAQLPNNNNIPPVPAPNPSLGLGPANPTLGLGFEPVVRPSGYTRGPSMVQSKQVVPELLQIQAQTVKSH